MLSAVRNLPGVRDVSVESEENGEITFIVECTDSTDRRAAVSKALTKAGCTVLALAVESKSLEDVFLELTGSESDKNSETTEGEEDADK